MKKLILAASMVAFSLTSFAQGGEWFASVGGGVNVYSDGGLSKGAGSSFALDLSAGKWFTPASGARLQYAGVSADGFAGNKAAGHGFNTIHADYLWNISNTIGGEKDRLWTFIPYAGFGTTFGKVGAKSQGRFALAGGLVNRVRVSESLDANLELRAVGVTGTFDGARVGKFRGRSMTSITVGLGYKF